MTTYAWTEHQMVVAPTEAGLTNVVKRVIATYVADDGTKTFRQLINVALDPPDPQNFTPYASLTESQVNGWMEAKLSMGTWQDYLDEQLLMQYEVPMACPWD